MLNKSKSEGCYDCEKSFGYYRFGTEFYGNVYYDILLLFI